MQQENNIQPRMDLKCGANWSMLNSYTVRHSLWGIILMNYKRKACSQKTQRILQFYPQNSLTVTSICIIQILEKQPPPLYYALDKFLKDGKQIEKEAFLSPPPQVECVLPRSHDSRNMEDGSAKQTNKQTKTLMLTHSRSRKRTKKPFTPCDEMWTGR